ncbi:hypothetical protein PIB30_011723 [Stylosanthes scabra]|uniref:Uncharacterized protein n=1 Tax=Stylosanthes scabra TaxID=79078 RepID=A0ABU6Y4A6_9FABA|nr:hypothetical protein [Stylosanthes scabra]
MNMKFNPRVSISRRKAYFTAPLSVRRVLQAHFSPSTLQVQRAVSQVRFRLFVTPTRACEGKVSQVYGRKGVIHIKRMMREKVNGSTVNIGIHLSKVVIAKLCFNKDRESLLDCKAKGRAATDKKKKGTKYVPEDILQTVDLIYSLSSSPYI